MFFKLKIGFMFLDIYFLRFTGNSSALQDCYSSSQRLRKAGSGGVHSRGEANPHAEKDEGGGEAEAAAGEKNACA